ncbi:unnamed protein product [Gulo gulo]|uniref:Uteroglobin n=1 Tax=Gulo gulo TaxID=48420 RepID=A0A9X9LJ97_GULGU|nr:unnamed protein product [Gulo gulo]
MRLFLSVLLVTLALCCSKANGIVCPALVTEVEGFLLLSMSAYNATVQILCDPPQEIIEAKMTVKACTDQMSFKNKMLISSTLVPHRVLRKKTPGDTHSNVEGPKPGCVIAWELFCEQDLPSSGHNHSRIP